MSRIWKFLRPDPCWTSPYVPLRLAIQLYSLLYLLLKTRKHKVFPSLPWTILTNYQTQGEDLGKPHFMTSYSEVQVRGWDFWNWLLKWGQLCRTEPLTCMAFANSSQLVSELTLNCRTPSCYPPKIGELFGIENPTYGMRCRMCVSRGNEFSFSINHGGWGNLCFQSN